MQHIRALGLGLMVCVFLLSSGCASYSSSKATLQEATKITKGQELNDLVRAKQAGALTEDEFESLRQTIMKRPN